MTAEGTVAPLRVVIAGAGRFGELHLRAWQEAAAEVVGVVDVDPARAEQVASRWGVGRHGASLADVLERTPADAVVVASDEGSHSSLADGAIARGCDVFVEKPFALSTQAAERTAAAAAAGGREVVVGQISRFAQPYRYLRSALQDGLLGTLWATRLRRDFSRAWFADFGDRVHPVWESCIHDIDLAVFLHGEPATKVYASESGAAGDAAPSVISAIVTFASGATSTIESAWTVPARGPQSLAGLLALDGSIDGEVQVIGSAGTARQRLIGDALTVWTDELSLAPDLSLWPEEDGRVGGALRSEVAYAASVFRRERANTLMPLEQAVWGVAIAEAIVESARLGRPITL
ncbi:Gfo/Idh/MocA family oxidoreductase [Leifsonia sp. F6_8S_P_1B]|uniref:Gfo/Idh/MocA family oxidoreductase n=1 Tax=Leifsonia williamsii TaxID=3035919 RepID=A0ABT8K6Z0_9MICO|nr:Gfo/Idh/MocA family oxidoreductase [Leifsonia williamsii]MDN4612942.1 Gfo/Idh/MocA family oxidoreductase [Leifsonia williamsii]